MTEIGGSVRCPRGHLTAAGYQFCTTCGERVAPDPSIGGREVPPPLDDDSGSEGIGFALPADLEAPTPGADKKRGRLRGGIGRRAPKAVAEPVAEAPPAHPPELALEPPKPPKGRGGRFGRKKVPKETGVLAPVEPPALLPLDPPNLVTAEPVAKPPKGGAGRLRRKKAEPEAAPGPSILTDADAPDLEPVEYMPPPSGPPPASSAYADVEFAIGPGTKSVVTYGRAERATTPSAGPKRGPGGLPTGALIAILLVVAAIGAAIIFFVTRDPATPSVAPSTLPTVQPTTSAPVATVAPVAVSEECGNAFGFAAAHAAEAEAPKLQQRTLRLCTTSDEWLAAARLHPTAIGVTDPSEVGEDDLTRVCSGAPGVGICRSVATTAPTSAAPTPGAPTATSTAVPSP